MEDAKIQERYNMKDRVYVHFKVAISTERNGKREDKEKKR